MASAVVAVAADAASAAVLGCCFSTHYSTA